MGERKSLEAIIEMLGERIKNLEKELEEKNRQLRESERYEYLAYHDLLTNLPNRLLLMDRLSLEIAHAKREKRLLAILFLDLDGFKAVNDVLGHEAGDQFLKLVAEQLTSLVREIDTVSRLGGDEFVLLLPGIKRDANQMEGIGNVVKRIYEVFSKPRIFHGKQFTVTMSTGVAVYPFHGEDGETLLRRADIAMYESKKAGGNIYSLYHPAHVLNKVKVKKPT